MDHNAVQNIYLSLQKRNTLSPHTSSKINPLKGKNGKRPNSISIEDGFFGDSGKGRVTAELNAIFGKKHTLYSLRYNGGANAGHECYVNGKQIVVHQLPIAIIQENATAMIGRGTLLHPEDLLTELNELKKSLGGAIPGSLIIDERTPLGLDTHRALESALNSFTTGGQGSTGRGIATGYASVYERIVVTVKDLLAPSWKDIFIKHYQLYQMLTRGFGTAFNLKDIPVASMGNQTKKRFVGTEKEFLKRLESTRSTLKKYTVPTLYSILKEIWNDPKNFFTLEGAQGAGLDPYHGVYPDVTASRPMSRNIADSSYNIILPEEISMRLAVIKTTYMSSVGKRRLPTKKDEAYEKWVQQTFDEKGRSTGRLRDIYPISLPIGHYLRRASGYDYLVATHIDAAKENAPIKIVTHYTHQKTGKELPYFPYQDYLDMLVPHFIEFPSWNGESVKKIRKVSSLPKEAKLYLLFLSKALAPVIFGTVDIPLGSFISWMPTQ